MKIRAFISAIFLVTWFGFATGVQGSWYWPPASPTRIAPEKPTDADKITITLSGDWPDSCVPTGSSIRVEGHDIFFDVVAFPPAICLTVISSWEQSQTVDPLETGHYRVFGRLQNNPHVPEVYSLLAEFDVEPAPIALPYWLEAVEIDPLHPTPLDEILITLKGIWPDTCAPESSSVAVVDNQIYFTVSLPFQNACGDFPTPWEQAQKVGPLPPGKYQVLGVLDNPLIEAPLIPRLIAEFEVGPTVVTKFYRFLSPESSLRVTGGIAGIDETVPVFGRFQLTLNLAEGKASFDRVKARYGEGHFFPSGSLGALFHTTELEGVINPPGTAIFSGVDDNGHPIRMQVQYITDSGRTIVTGGLPAEPVCCDFFHYDLQAVAVPIHPCLVDFHYLANWLNFCATDAGDLDNSGVADVNDMHQIALYWLQQCPFDWLWAGDE